MRAGPWLAAVVARDLKWIRWGDGGWEKQDDIQILPWLVVGYLLQVFVPSLYSVDKPPP
jgi:hypothetical protein